MGCSGVGVLVGSATGVFVGGTGVSVGRGVGVSVGSGVFVAVGVLVGVGVAVGVSVGVGVRVKVGVTVCKKAMVLTLTLFAEKADMTVSGALIPHSQMKSNITPMSRSLAPGLREANQLAESSAPFFIPCTALATVWDNPKPDDGLALFRTGLVRVADDLTTIGTLIRVVFPFAALLAKRGLYRRLYDMQFR